MTEQEVLIQKLSEYTDTYILVHLKKKSVLSIEQAIELDKIESQVSNQILQTLVEYRSPLVEDFFKQLINNQP